MPKKPLQLGQPTAIPASPEEAVLDRVPNPHPDADYVARFTFPEFTAMCPVTGQPDFATLVIDYVPRGPKETWSLITWFLYAALLHQRLTVGWRGRKAAIMAIIGFLAVLFTFLGVNLLLPGLHTYANW